MKQELSERIVKKAMEISLIPTFEMMHYFDGELPYNSTPLEVLEKLKFALEAIKRYLVESDEDPETHPDVLRLQEILSLLELAVSTSRSDIEQILKPFLELDPDTFQPLLFECDDLDESFQLAAEQTGQPITVFKDCFSHLKKLQRYPGYIEACERIEEKVLVEFNPFNRGVTFSISLNKNVRIEFKILPQVGNNGIYGDSHVRLVAEEKNIALKLVETINFNARYNFAEAMEIMVEFFDMKPFHLGAALTEGTNPERIPAQEKGCFFVKIDEFTQLRYEFEFGGQSVNWAALTIIAMSKDKLIILHPQFIE